jgi:type VI secretion system secreted protein VgrG
MPLQQSTSPIRITTKLGPNELVLHQFSGSEGVSTPFEFRVRMLSHNASIDLKSLLRTSATITVVLEDGKQRYFNGRFSRLSQGARTESKLVNYEGVIVPSLWFLNLSSDCRIFQNLSAKAIIEKILQKHEITDFRFNLSADLPVREYCVQYRETDFNFVSRLLEEEGIFYFFEHSDGKHNLVFADKKSAFAPCPIQSTFSCAFSADSWSDEDGVLAFDRCEAVYTGKVSLTDYDFQKPATNLAVNIGSDAENYDHPGSYLDLSEGRRRSRIRLEQSEVPRLTFEGRGSCRVFTSGYKFTLKDHYRNDLNAEYVLLSVRHEAMDSTFIGGDNYGQPFSYSNTFEAIPATQDYRPPLRAVKPVIQGLQSALVVGKAGEEIWVDKYGRVKVHFYWDRESNRDEKSSCWVRVSQAWAGKNWGFVTIPRIGQEVLVEFLEGDPDRPLITGRVYNADQMPPYTLPDNQTQSGWKSRSSKGGTSSTFNEIRFEDKSGSEMLSIQAQKDMETLVKHDQTNTIKNDKTITVEGKHTETITKDTTITIQQGNESITLQQGSRSTSIKMGNDSIKIDMGKSTTEAMQSIELKVGANSIKIDQSGITIKGIMVTIEGTAMLEAKSPMTQVKGDGMLILKGGLTMIN